jgi:hypothetical protein
MTFQTIGVVLHPSQPYKGIGMGVFSPSPKVFEMTEAALPVADIVLPFTGKNIAGAEWEQGGRKRT